MPPPRDWALAVLVGLACVAFTFPAALAGRASLVPGEALRGDPVYAPAFAPGATGRRVWDASGILVHYPAERVAAGELRAGRPPLWNPYVGAGAPLLAEAHSAPLSPLLLPFFARPSERTYSWALLLRLVLAAAGAFLLVLDGGQAPRRAAATLAAVTYAIGGCAAVRFELPTEGSAYALLPFAVLAARRAAAGARPAAGVAALALVVGVTLYAAHPELAALAAAGAVVLEGCRRPRDLAAWLRLAGGAAGGVVVGAAVALPLVAFVAGGGASYKTDARLLALFASDATYPPVAPDLLRVGAAPLLLAAAALAARRRTAAETAASRALLATGALLTLLLAVQAWAPASIRGLVPPRYGVFLVVLAASLAAAEGFERVAAGRLDAGHAARACAAAAVAWAGLDALTWGRLHRLPDVAFGEAASALAVVGLAVVAWPRAGRPDSPARRRAAGWVVVAVGAAALIVSARRVTATSGGGVPETEAVAALRALVAGRPPGAAAPPRVIGLGAWIDAAPVTPNLASLYGLADARAVAAIFPARYRAYMSLVDGVRTQPTTTLVERANSPLLDLLGVEHVVAPAARLPAGWPVTWRAVGSDLAIARNPRAAPRAFVPAELGPARDLPAALRALERLARDRCLPRCAVVEAPVAALARLGSGRATVRVVEHRADRVVLDVQADAPALVVLTEAWDAGWRARVDGRRAPVWPVDVLFRGVPVEAGARRVVLEYRPGSFRVGAALAVCGILACAAILVWPALGRARRRAAGSPD